MLTVLQVIENVATTKFDLIETSNLADHVVNTLPNLLAFLYSMIVSVILILIFPLLLLV